MVRWNAGTPKRTLSQRTAYSNPPRSPNPCQSGHRKRGRRGQRGRSRCVRCHRQSNELGLIRALPWPLQAGICRMPLVCGFVKLVHSLAPRIVVVCKPRYRTCLLYVGRCEGALAGHLEPNIHAHAYTRDIRNFAQTHPRATILDLEMYRDAWLEGVEWVESSSCK